MYLFKISFIILLSLLLSSGKYSKISESAIYLANRDSMTLKPTTQVISYSDKNDLCGKILDRLMLYQKNPDRAELLPTGIKITVLKDCAFVDFPEIPDLGKSRSLELLTIYSLVNSLTSSGEIVTVRFTAKGEIIKDFNGTVDMTESFVPDYDICS